MNIRPLKIASSFVAWREATTAGGIVLPGAAAEKPNQGEIVAVGTVNHSITEKRAMSVSVGDKS